jgi:hypothetical protein
VLLTRRLRIAAVALWLVGSGFAQAQPRIQPLYGNWGCPPTCPEIIPTVQVTSHTDNQIVTSESIVLAGLASNVDPLWPSHYVASVTVNGLEAALDPVGGKSVTWSLTMPIAPGSNALNVTVRASGSQSSTITWHIYGLRLGITGLTPARVWARGSAFTLVVNGPVFAEGSTVLWNGSPRPTTFVSATELRAVIAAGDIVTPGPVAVSVQDAAPSTAVSAAVGLPVVTAASDFAGVGRGQFAAFHPFGAHWVVEGLDDRSAGAQGDILVPADYDGDGRVERATYRPTTGYWYIEGMAPVPFGAAGDIPVPADYDGDGKAEIAVFRPNPVPAQPWNSSSTWYFFDGTAIPWGRAGDVPVPADYNGDGKAEIAVFRGAYSIQDPHFGSQWWIVGQPSPLGLGTNGDIPVPADYNGDGKAEAATWRPTDGTWRIQGQSAPIQWGVTGDLPIPADYDGDGRAELVAFRPQTAEWFCYVVATGAMSWTTVGEPADIPVLLPASYQGTWYLVNPRYESRLRLSDLNPIYRPRGAGDVDGDGKRDLTIYRPADSMWWTLFSASDFSTWQGVAWGQPGDRQVGADYDGDGKMDLATYRPMTGEWWIRQSTGGTVVRAFGLPTDIPVPADYDGDGKADVAVYRPSTRVWYFLLSGTGYLVTTSQPWGATADDVPVPVDYDGDGRADVAVYIPATGEWCIWFSGPRAPAPQYEVRHWGAAGDLPVPADWDGDGITDIAVYRPATADWWWYSAGVPSTWGRVEAWGAPTDLPVPASYVTSSTIQPTVYRPGDGYWWMRLGAGSYRGIPWGGLPGDTPVPTR